MLSLPLAASSQITLQAWESSPLAILTLDREGVVQSANPAGVRVLARDENALIGLELVSIAHSLDGLALKKMLEVAGKGQTPGRQELRFRRPDGTDVTTGFSVAPGDGATHVVCVLRDLSREKTFRPQLLHTERMASMGLVASVVAHELNNALTGAMGCLELLQLDATNEQQGLVRTALQELARSAEIVGEIKGYARSEDELDQRIAIGELTESVARLHRFHHQPGEKWSLAIELPKFAREIEGNKNQLLQALLNLVRNAEDAVRDLPLDRKELRLRVEAERDVVHFSVIDRGPGVPEELRSRLFDPFYSTKAAGAGTGLGLSVVQSIAAGHGGRVEVLDTPGGGATFRLTIPINDLSSEPVSRLRTGTEQELAVDLGGARVLVADDEQTIRRVLESVLPKLGAEVVVADSAEAAIAALEGESFDLALLDVRMADGGGPRVFRHIRERCPELAAKTLFMSGELSVEMNDIRGDEYAGILPKPFKLAELAEALDRALGGER